MNGSSCRSAAEQNAALARELAPLGFAGADIEPEDFARLVDVDLVAAHALVKLVVPGMIERGWGRLILVCLRQRQGKGLVLITSAN